MSGSSAFVSHDIFNQSPPFVDVDLFALDRPLQEAVRANGGVSEQAALSAFGRRWGSAEFAENARLANEHVPRLKIFDRIGFRRDIVEFHPAYHAFMAESMAAGLHGSTWNAEGARAPAPAEVLRAARYYMVAQVENGHMCPVTMTRASVAALAAAPDVRAQWLPRILATHYDPSFRPWQEKTAVTLGMGMTEKQGGTDVRTNTTRAVPDGEGYRITGHKWFMSAPMCDSFLVLAQAPGGLTCFLIPRFAADEEVNALRFQRLKDKLGNRSNASSEVEFAGAFAWRIGEEGRGIRTIIEMVQLTRLDCAIASAGLMRMALAQATHHARHRTVFQKKLADQPMMRAVLADLALELEGSVALVFRLCRAFDHAVEDRREAAYARLLTPAVKYWVCKSAPAFICEAMECLGGNGYVEDDVLARLYREAPVNAIWEGSGNVMGLDVLRVLAREGEEAGAVLDELAQTCLSHAGGADSASSFLRPAGDAQDERHARRLVERLAWTAATAALAACAPQEITAAFARTRHERSGRMYGASNLSAAEIDMLMSRVLPA